MTPQISLVFNNLQRTAIFILMCDKFTNLRIKNIFYTFFSVEYFSIQQKFYYYII
jgi:hypothetical protein